MWRNVVFVESTNEKWPKVVDKKKQYRDIDKAGLMHTTCSTELLLLKNNEILIN